MRSSIARMLPDRVPYPFTYEAGADNRLKVYTPETRSELTSRASVSRLAEPWHHLSHTKPVMPVWFVTVSRYVACKE